MDYRYITTPIYYSNGAPHLGHAFTTLIADTYKKYYELQGYRPKLVTGCDEHGQKIQLASEAKGITPQELVDSLASTFKNCWTELGVEIDGFVRTTGENHKKYVQDVWKRLDERGHIYFGQYSGLYCIGCEQYYKSADLLEDNRCPIHETKCDEISEDSYFFRLSSFQNELIEKIKSDEFSVTPQNRKSEILSFLEGNELQDLSISRNTFSWGIAVPGSEDHVMYVWLDALFNYISILGGDQSEEFGQYWPNTTHLLGKDILRFHSVYWPAFLLALGIELPKKLVVHGWWKVSNRKISKSDPATKVNPLTLIKYFQRDGLRYVLLNDGSFERDGNFDYKRAQEIINSDLANNLGNMVNRVTKLSNKFFGGKLPEITLQPGFKTEEKLIADFVEGKNKYLTAFENDVPSEAVKQVIELSDILNLYINDEKPWAKFKDASKADEVAMNLAVCMEGIRWIKNLGYPFFPDICNRLNYNLFKDSAFTVPSSFTLDAREVFVDEIIFARIPEEDLTALLEELSAE
jgi:methionyl-tRNA synthetase